MAKNPKIIVETPRGSVVTVKAKNGTVKAKLKWNEGFGKKKTAVFDRGQAIFDSEVMRQMTPYMQLVTGAMIHSMTLGTDIGSGEIRVITPYAKSVYYSSAPVGRPTGPLRGPYYFERMKADKSNYLKDVAEKAVKAK